LLKTNKARCLVACRWYKLCLLRSGITRGMF